MRLYSAVQVNKDNRKLRPPGPQYSEAPTSDALEIPSKIQSGGMILPEMTSIHLPLSSIIPPSTSNPGPSHTVPVPNYILGPLPPTSPLHLALHYLDLADDATRECASGARHDNEGQNITEDEHDGKGALNTPTRVLLVTGPKAAFQDAIESEDERWFREHGGWMSVIQKLKRIDMR